jgi:GWxTD domain-containing protein
MAVVFAGCASGGDAELAARASEAAKSWAEGPARWLLLPEERDALRAVGSQAELSAFLQVFWRRRDDDPATPDIPLAHLFAERVTAADRLYAEEGVRGSSTDRGGALVLLGPPSILGYSTRAALTREGRRAPGARPTRPVRLENWTYLPADLPPPLRASLLRDGEGRVELTFLLGPQHTRLIEGREFYGRAACAWARCDPEE